MEEKYFLHYSAETGEIKGFYLKSIHGDNIPTPIKEITQEKHQFYMDNQGKYKLNLSTLEDELLPVVVIESTEKSTEQRVSDLELLVLQLGGVI